MVNRVDNMGRAYAVTNFNTANGFIINEVMLYDPSQPAMGKFHEWYLRKNNKLGTTGLGGFELWRLTQPIQEKSPQQESLARELDSVMSGYGGDWYVAVKHLNGKVIYDRQATVPVDIGSMMKLPVAMLFFKSLEFQGITPESTKIIYPPRDRTEAIAAAPCHVREFRTSRNSFTAGGYTLFRNGSEFTDNELGFEEHPP